MKLFSKKVIILTLFLTLKLNVAVAQEAYLGQIILFAGTFAPHNWAECNGQELSIASNTALFSLLGTTYGGNGTTTFALPDLRGRTPIGIGQGTGLHNYSQGEKGGTESTTLIMPNLPLHETQTMVPAPSHGAGEPPVQTTSLIISPTQTPIDNRQPYLGLRYIICVQGIYPSRP